MGKTDSGGTYSYICDGTSPGAPVLSDGHAVYTLGLSENRGGVSRYYSFDRRGNLWTVDGGGISQLYYEDETAFGSLFALSGSVTPYGFDGVDGCQRESDSVLVLMGHRYYDSRLGRFISQDPSGDGDNWYAYADNDPVDEVDPEGLQSVDEGNRQADYLVDEPGYNGREMQWNDSNVPSYTDDNGVMHSVSFVNVPSGDDDGGGLFSGVGGAAMVGVSAVGSAFSGGLWNGGSARHDPSFGTSKTLAYVGVAAGSAALGAVGAVGKATEGTVTVAKWGREGLESGDWVMKGPATRWNYVFSFKWQRGFGNEFSPFEDGQPFEVPSSSIKWPTGAGIDGWWKGLFGQRVYMP